MSRDTRDQRLEKLEQRIVAPQTVRTKEERDEIVREWLANGDLEAALANVPLHDIQARAAIAATFRADH